MVRDQALLHPAQSYSVVLLLLIIYFWESMRLLRGDAAAFRPDDPHFDGKIIGKGKQETENNPHFGGGGE